MRARFPLDVPSVPRWKGSCCGVVLECLCRCSVGRLILHKEEKKEKKYWS